jgi:predicted negative regulator of RcsB-dependent stress response
MSNEDQIPHIKGIESLKDFYESNKKNINIAGIAAILLLAGVYYYFKFYKPSVETDAKDSFFMAERYFGQDSLNLALNGDGMNLGMINIADEYGSTKTGNLASYYAGVILLKQGKYQQALDYIKDVDMEDEIMAAQVLTLQGDCYSELGDYKAAGKKYRAAADKRDNEMTAPYALKKAGVAFEEAGELNDALDAYTDLFEDYNKVSSEMNVESYIARVKAKIAAKK